LWVAFKPTILYPKNMSLLLLAPNRDMKPWQEALYEIDTNLEIEIWPNVKSNKRVHFIVAWDHPKHTLGDYPNLKAISSLGAGVDHILRDESLPGDIPVCRVVSPSLVTQMKEYVLAAVLNYQRNFFTYANQRYKADWDPHPNKDRNDFSVGFMGLGKLGLPAAKLLAKMGYDVLGWSKSEKEMEGITTFAGNPGLPDFLRQTKLLICMLPLTEETGGILDLELLKMLDRPAYLINVARGEHLVEEDLIYALEKSWIDGALLDVFVEEPLPEEHPFWNREQIMITPHVSSLTPPQEVAEQLHENYKRVLSGMEPANKVDREKGY
jgi:glyoxylate/hydroxypyruvate reductase A